MSEPALLNLPPELSRQVSQLNREASGHYPEPTWTKNEDTDKTFPGLRAAQSDYLGSSISRAAGLAAGFFTFVLISSLMEKGDANVGAALFVGVAIGIIYLLVQLITIPLWRHSWMKNDHPKTYGNRQRRFLAELGELTRASGLGVVVAPVESNLDNPQENSLLERLYLITLNGETLPAQVSVDADGNAHLERS